MKLVEQIYQDEHQTGFRTRYIKYRAGRLKHQYWLWNRKHKEKVIDEYDALILKNCQIGKTAFFCSAGYYLKDIWPTVDSIEMHPIVKEFYKDIILVKNRQELSTIVLYKYDNFAVVNNRGDHWVSVDGLTQHLINYSKILNPGARVFYSFRDTQIHYNRLKVNSVDYFKTWSESLVEHGFDVVWSDIKFERKNKDHYGNYSLLENPDTTNGNLKFWFTYKGKSWSVIT